MPDQILPFLLYNAGLLLLLVGIYSVLRLRPSLSDRAKDLITGLITGFIGLALMSTPWKLMGGLVFDLRTVLLGSTALFFGAVPAAIAAAIAGAYRIHMGGVGLWPGLATIFTATGLGLAWRRWRPAPLETGSPAELYLFGIAVHLLMLACMFLMPLPVALATLRKISLPVILIYPLAMMLTGILLHHQREYWRMAAELRESGKKYRRLFENMRDAYALADMQGRIKDFNPVYLNMLGYSAGELLKSTYLDLTPEKWHKDEARILGGEFLARGYSEVYEKEYRKKDGTIFPVELRAFLIRDAAGAPAGMWAIVRDITERKRLTNAIKAQEVRFRELFENMNSPVAVFEPCGEGRDFRFINANRALEKTEAVARKDLLGRKVTEVFPGAERFGLLEVLRRVNATGKAELIPARFYKDDRIFGWRENYIYKLPSGEVVVLYNDLTERKKWEESLLASEKKLKEAQRIAGIGSWELHIPSGKLDWSDEVYAIFELSPEKYKPSYEAFLAAIHPEDREKVNLAYLGSVEKRSGYNIVHRLAMKDGRVKHVREICETDYGEDGKPLLSRGTVQDITALMEAESGLHRLQAAIEQAAETVVITDAQGTIVYVNPEFERVTGYSSAEVLGRNPSVLKSGRQDEAFYKKLWETISSGHTWTGIMVNRRKDASLYTEEATISPVFEGGGAPVNYVAVKRDITDRLRMEEDLIKSQRIESLGVLAGGIAHDFNNMLMGITGNLSLLLPQLTDGADLVKEALSATRSAQGLTAQLLSFSRGGQPVKKETDMRDALKDIFSLSTRGVAAKASLALQDGLWEVNCDEVQIKQAIGNLLINAVQAMPAGGEVSLAAANLESAASPAGALPPGKYLKIEVADTGIGIPQKYLDRMFEPYFTTKTKGHGLGLAMAWNVVRSHGGHLEVSSAPGQGTVFTLYLPATGRRGAGEAPGAAAIRKGSGRILLLEDEEVVWKAVRRMLETLGYTCEIATDGKEAVELYLREKTAGRPFAAAIFDLTIPGGTGGRAAGQELRRHDPEAKIVVSSGYSEDSTMSDSAGNGFDAALQKPYRYEDLAATLAKLLEPAAPTQR